MARAIAACLFAVLGCWLLAGSARVKAQDGGIDGLIPQLIIVDPTDMRIMFAALEETALSTAIRSHLGSRSCTRAGWETVSIDSLGTRIVRGGFLFGNSAPVTLLDVDYLHSHESGEDPEIPPDQISFSSMNFPAPQFTGIVFPNRLTFEFLLHAWTEEDDEFEAPLDAYDLVDFWVEVTGQPGSEALALRLVYRNTTTLLTRSISGQHLGAYAFGPLSVN